MPLHIKVLRVGEEESLKDPVGFAALSYCCLFELARHFLGAKEICNGTFGQPKFVFLYCGASEPKPESVNAY